MIIVLDYQNTVLILLMILLKSWFPSGIYPSYEGEFHCDGCRCVCSVWGEGCYVRCFLLFYAFQVISDFKEGITFIRYKMLLKVKGFVLEDWKTGLGSSRVTVIQRLPPSLLAVPGQ